MPDVTNPALFEVAATELAEFSRSARQYRGRFAQIFLALKFYQNEVPSMYSGQFITTEVLQTMLDDLYSKATRPLEDCVFVLFGNSYKARTGIRAPGNTTAQNTWRNNFNLQKGIGCYAPPAELSSRTFLDQARSECRFLRPGNDRGLAGGVCNLCPSGATYRNEDHRKWLKIDPGGNGYAALDLMDTHNYLPYVAPNNQKIPVWPLIIGLYHDSDPTMKHHREVVELEDFFADFNFSEPESRAYFELSPENPANHSILSRVHDATRRPVQVQEIAVTQEQIGRRAVQQRQRQREPQPIPEPILTGTPVTPPAVNSGWEGEQYVAKALRDAGWTVYDVSRQRLGYDLLAKRGVHTRYIDVKSSVGYCSPTLTGREWRQAQLHRTSYVLAIIETFNPTREATIYWVPDPTDTCISRESIQVLFAIPRTSWTRATVLLTQI